MKPLALGCCGSTFALSTHLQTQIKYLANALLHQQFHLMYSLWATQILHEGHSILSTKVNKFDIFNSIIEIDSCEREKCTKMLFDLHFISMEEWFWVIWVEVKRPDSRLNTADSLLLSLEFKNRQIISHLCNRDWHNNLRCWGNRLKSSASHRDCKKLLKFWQLERPSPLSLLVSLKDL